VFCQNHGHCAGLKWHGKTGRTGKARKPAYMSCSEFDPVVRVGSIPVLFLSISIAILKNKLLKKGICIAFIPMWERSFFHNIQSIIRFLQSKPNTARFTPSLQSGRPK
jgi:hypothetical protein